MKRLAIVLLLMFALSANAYAMEVPSEITIQNLNGNQQYIKVYTVSPGTDPATLIGDPFDYEGFHYTYAAITKQENRLEETLPRAETVTVNTTKNDLSEILATLAPTIEYKDGTYAGTLRLDHTSLHTEAAGYARKSYTVSETKSIGNLSSNDMSYVPSTTVKNGMTLNLANVEWQVQSTALVDDVLVPSQYQAVATYSSRASYQAATGYITTAEYTGQIACSAVDSITYTVTYLGTKQAANTLGETVLSALPTAGIIGGTVIALAAIVVLSVLLVRTRRELGQLHTLHGLPEGEEFEEEAE